MSGSWRLSSERVREKHTHVQLKTVDERGRERFLAYVDPRRFGNMHFLHKDGLNEWMKRLGADVSSPQFDFDYVKGRLTRYPNKVIKPFLLEQNHFAGVGNYMASEICARAKVLPMRKAGSLNDEEIHALVSATKSVLTEAIQTNGTTFSGGYQDANGDAGEGVKNLVVFYQDTCRMCHKTEVIKITLAGRGTYYCPHCQH